MASGGVLNKIYKMMPIYSSFCQAGGPCDAQEKHSVQIARSGARSALPPCAASRATPLRLPRCRPWAASPPARPPSARISTAPYEFMGTAAQSGSDAPAHAQLKTSAARYRRCTLARPPGGCCKPPCPSAARAERLQRAMVTPQELFC